MIWWIYAGTVIVLLSCECCSHTNIVLYQTFSKAVGTVLHVQSSGLQSGYVAPKDNEVLSRADDLLEPYDLPVNLGQMFPQSGGKNLFVNRFLPSVTFSSVTHAKGLPVLSASSWLKFLFRIVIAYICLNHAQNYTEKLLVCHFVSTCKLYVITTHE